MGKKPETVWDLPRNDVDACRRYWLAHEITGEDWRVMLKLQDDPAELIESSRTWAKPGRRPSP